MKVYSNIFAKYVTRWERCKLSDEILFYKDAYIVFLSDCVFIIDKRSQGRVNQVDVLSGSVNRALKAGDRNQESHATHLNTSQNTRLWVRRDR